MNSILNKYDTVIFDMDGVITNESSYWDAAALTVNEYLHSNSYFGNEKINCDECMKNRTKLRNEIFCDGKAIMHMKEIGVNSNWDLTYVTICIALILDTDDYEKIYEYAQNIKGNILNFYDSIASLASKKICKDFEYVKRSGSFWTEIMDCFQEWFLGDKIFYENYGRMPYEEGKKGILGNEAPIIPLEDLHTLLSGLKENHRICIATGRNRMEMCFPLQDWDALKYIDANGMCSYDEVAQAQKTLNNNTLSKPHPYAFLKALYGLDYPDEKIVNGDYDKEKINRALIVGDAGADILAAKAMGADFCGVLTGAHGKNVRSYFEELDAAYIFDDVRGLLG